MDPNTTGIKFCKHCDVMIVGEGYTKSTGNPSEINQLFCSSACYMQHSLSQRHTMASLQQQAGNAPAVVNHVSSINKPAGWTQAVSHRAPPAAVSAAASAVASAATSVSNRAISTSRSPVSSQQTTTNSVRTHMDTSSLLSSVSMKLQKSPGAPTAAASSALPSPPASRPAMSPRPTSQGDTFASQKSPSVTSTTNATPQTSTALTTTSSSSSTVPQFKLNIKPPVRPQGKPMLIPPTVHNTEGKDVKEEVKPVKPFRRKGSHHDEHVVCREHCANVLREVETLVIGHVSI